MCFQKVFPAVAESLTHQLTWKVTTLQE